MAAAEPPAEPRLVGIGRYVVAMRLRARYAASREASDGALSATVSESMLSDGSASTIVASEGARSKVTTTA